MERHVTLKDWITSTLAVLAIIISAGSAYINLIRQDDDLRMVVQGDLRFRSEPSSNKEPSIGLFPEDQRVTFINLGNRPASITALSLLVTVYDVDKISTFDVKKGAMECNGGHLLAYDIEPFTIKASESISKSLQFAKRPDLQSQDGWTRVSIKDFKGEATYFVACIEVSAVTPQIAKDNLNQPLDRGIVPRDPNKKVEGFFMNDENTFILIKQRGTIFW
jgi:hypothetical protein